MKPDSTPDPLRFFYRLDYSRVSHRLLARLLVRRLRRARSSCSSRSAGGRSRSPTSRATGRRGRRCARTFPDAIFWAADVTTDAEGRATVQVPYPDALTTWRLTARAVTADTRVGTAVARTTTTKDLIVRVVTPRFLTEGDTSTCRSSSTTTCRPSRPSAVTRRGPRLQAAAPGGAPSAGGSADAARSPTGRRGAARLALDGADGRHGRRSRAPATTGDDGDAVELPFPVLPFGLKREAGQRPARSPAPGEQTAEIDGARRRRTRRPGRFASSSRRRWPVRCSARSTSSPAIRTAAPSRRCRASCRTWPRARTLSDAEPARSPSG